MTNRPFHSSRTVRVSRLHRPSILIRGDAQPLVHPHVSHQPVVHLREALSRSESFLLVPPFLMSAWRIQGNIFACRFWVFDNTIIGGRRFGFSCTCSGIPSISSRHTFPSFMRNTAPGCIRTHLETRSHKAVMGRICHTVVEQWKLVLCAMTFHRTVQES